MFSSGRLEKFCDTDGSDDVLVSRIEDIRWLTGFTGGTAQCVVHRTKRRGTLFVDGRYFDRACKEVREAHASVDVRLISHAQSFEDALKKMVTSSLGVNPRHVMAQHLRDISAIVPVVDEPDHLDQLRRVKDEREIEVMERAAHIADEALQTVVADGLIGKTEKQIRNHLEYLMRVRGADGPGFSTIVATGTNGASAHHEPTDAVVEVGHGVVIDMGAEIDGYRSDMTRTVMVGNVGDDYQEMFDVVRQAQLAGVETVRSGVCGADVDASVRAVFAAHGCEHEFTHGTGHGIGLYIHEFPILSPRCTAVLQSHEVVTVEPGLYRGGVGGVRIEDQVVVTDTGCRILTLSPKELSCPQSPQTI
jgi:Xaa-Pro aminopeptidase